ncbi:MAG: hypothetical protein VB040_11380 [Propionibacterium sp.]|nr:hypothetical protein [Propionibacterium sp.]
MTNRVALTGAGGFLGWHTRLALAELGSPCRSLAVGDRFDLDAARQDVSGASRVIHLAGVNRASDEQIVDGNIRFARQLSEALAGAVEPPKVVVFANSTQASNGTAYGGAKARAGEVLAEAAQRIGAEFVDLHLPNLFGEHGRPFYNAVTATFCHLLAGGERPAVQDDKELTLLHAQNAADLLVGELAPEEQASVEAHETVSGLLHRLEGISRVYADGEIPDIADSFQRDLFNTYRSYTFDSLTPIRLTRHADDRGSFFEIIRSHGGNGQSSFSTTVPGITRGDHFHRRKVERFTVLAGSATISLRRLFSGQVHNFQVCGDDPVAIDMPTGWSHKITNTGSSMLYTSFWANELFDPERPDTTSEMV